MFLTIEEDKKETMAGGLWIIYAEIPNQWRYYCSNLREFFRKDPLFLEQVVAYLPRKKQRIDTAGIKEATNNLRDCFEDIQTRQLVYSELREKLRKACDILDIRDRNELILLSMLIDAVTNTKSENLSIKQIELIREIIGELDSDFNNEDLMEIQKRLINSGLIPVPIIEGIADLYDF